MAYAQKLTLFLLRIGLGWFFFYAGMVKVLNPEWSAAKYLEGAKTFASFYQWLMSPQILPIVNFLNEWGLTLLGISLLLGVFVRLSAVLGAILMLLYYFPVLDFPSVGPYAYIVDEHIIYALALWLLAAFRAGRVWGIEPWCASLPICSRFPKLRSILG